MGRRVLITRLGWFVSGRLAAALEEIPDIEYIVGVDLSEPKVDLRRTEFVRADIRRPVLAKLISAARIDTVVHLSMYSTPDEAGGRGAMHDQNIIGSMQVLGACQRAQEVKNVILRSSTAVYGSHPRDPAVFAEDDYTGSGGGGPFVRNVQEIEAYARDLARRRPDLNLTTLRLANILGPNSDTPLSNYLVQRVVPTSLGYDPRLQFLHEDDAVDLFTEAVRNPRPGTYNAAGDGVMYLSQVLRSGGRVELPMLGPAVSLTAPVLSMFGVGTAAAPHVAKLVQWGRVVDTTRLKERFGFVPRYTTRDAVREFYAERRLRRVAAANRTAGWESDLNEYVTRKGQERFIEEHSPT